MRLFLLIYFWLSFVLFIVDVLKVGLGKFPIVRSLSFREHCGQTIVRLAMVLWVGVLLWL